LFVESKFSFSLLYVTFLFKEKLLMQHINNIMRRAGIILCAFLLVLGFAPMLKAQTHPFVTAANFTSHGTFNSGSSNATINCNTGVLAITGGTTYQGVTATIAGQDFWVFSFDSFTLQSGRQITFTNTPGTRKIAIVATGNITIAGTISANASGTTAGPGGNANTAGGGTAGATNAGGGGGGANGGNGGAGGTSNGTAGGTANGNLLTSLTTGGGGGNGSVSGGASGGGILIGSQQTLILSGTINASGGSGANGTSTGGGGGGAGGSVTLHGSSLNLTGGGSM
jgi:hypothetical protein